jgi:hypothetical protein
VSIVTAHREDYRGIRITIEHHPDDDTAKPFAAHVPIPGHGYIGRYYNTQQGALRAAKQLVDDHFAPQQAPLDDAAAQVIEGVLSAVCHLIRAASRGDRAQHQSLLERCADHLGVRPPQFAINNAERHAMRSVLEELVHRGYDLSPPQRSLLDRLHAWKASADEINGHTETEGDSA